MKGYRPTLVTNHRAFKEVKPILKSLGAPKDTTFDDVQLVINEMCNTLEFALREYRQSAPLDAPWRNARHESIDGMAAEPKDARL